MKLKWGWDEVLMSWKQPLTSGNSNMGIFLFLQKDSANLLYACSCSARSKIETGFSIHAYVQIRYTGIYTVKFTCVPRMVRYGKYIYKILGVSADRRTSWISSSPVDQIWILLTEKEVFTLHGWMDELCLIEIIDWELANQADIYIYGADRDHEQYKVF